MMKLFFTFMILLLGVSKLAAQPVISVRDTLAFDGYVCQYWEVRSQNEHIRGDLIFNKELLGEVLNSHSYQELLSIPGVYIYKEITDYEYYKKLVWNFLNPTKQNSQYLFGRPRETDWEGVNVNTVPNIDSASLKSFLPNESNFQKLKTNRSEANVLLIRSVSLKGLLVEIHNYRVTDMFIYGSLEIEYAEKAKSLKVVFPMYQ